MEVDSNEKKSDCTLVVTLSCSGSDAPERFAATDSVQYVQVDSLDDLSEDGEYLIVFANSVAALGGSTSTDWQATPLEIHPISGNSGYFQVSSTDASALPTWSIKAGNDDSWQFSDQDGNLLTICSKTNLNLTHGTSSTYGNTWRLSTDDGVYLYNLEDEDSPNIISENNQTILGDLWSQYYAQMDVYTAANTDLKTAKADVESATDDYYTTLPDYVTALTARIQVQKSGDPDWYNKDDHGQSNIKEDFEEAYDENSARVETLQEKYDYDALKKAYDNISYYYQYPEYRTEARIKTYKESLTNLVTCLESICEEIESDPDTNYMDSNSSTLDNYKTAKAAVDAAQEKIDQANAVKDEKQSAVNAEYKKLAQIGDSLTAQMSGGIYGYSQIMQSGCANLLILRKADSKKLTVTDDRDAANLKTAITTTETRPKDTAYTNVSSSLTGTDTYSKTQTASGVNIRYASDASTSQIESLFGLRDIDVDSRTAAQQKNDGRVMTDKSVVYGTDDYGAIDTYEAGDFSVTLSALGQEFDDGDDKVATPIDVVFLLDLSQSMTNYTDPDKETLDMRWTSSVDAINHSMKQILDAGDENRVSVVCFSNTAVTVLPLGRYTADNDEYITYEEPSNFYSNDEALIEDMKTLQTADSLQDADGNSSLAGLKLKDYTGLFEQTYTQRGLEEVYNVFQSVDTTVEEEFNGEETSVSRQPVVVMVTDGDPTLATYNYMNPSSGPDYGDGFSYGIEGYYTILSANYFKNRISLHYQNRALFYTIGLGIKPDGHGNYRSDRTTSDSDAHEYSDSDNVDDAYRRAVLDPSDTNVKELTNGSGTDRDKETSLQMQTLLLGKDNSSIVQKVKPISNTYLTDGLGYTVMSMRGIDNPYSETGYDYVDESYFGNLTETDLEDIFSGILGGFAYVDNSVAPLADGTELTITDSMDSYMEVKEAPILRYMGKNYTPTKTKKSGEDVQYTYDNGISALVHTDQKSGQTTVTLTVPAEVLPAFHTDLYSQFYYEEMPVRLIYRVGLTDEEQTQIQKMSDDETKTYYTNLYDETSSQAGTYALFTPASNNPYYAKGTKTASTITKTDTKITGTCSYAFAEDNSSESGQIRQYLGNNGKLIVSKSSVIEESSETSKPSDDSKLTDTSKTSDKAKSTHGVSTGDPQRPVFYLVIFCLAAGILLFLLRRKR